LRSMALDSVRFIVTLAWQNNLNTKSYRDWWNVDGFEAL